MEFQAHEGWRLIPDRYDDGAFSGASLDRPALQTLLNDIKSKKIDIVVVYKVDRLTRSLADFAKLVELFDQNTVSFVSVTQSFNTTSSMGRLTLNVLLSFAQFEREVIGERVRDKIAASKRKGIWVGGPIPLGYASVDKKLVVIPEEAEAVRTIFRRYLELGSVGALVEDLDQRGIHTRRRGGPNGRVGGIRFGVGSVAHLLKNRFYIGDVVYRGEIFRGEHEAIVDPELFAAVQAKLAANGVDRQLRLKAAPAILMGRIFDHRGNRMTPTHTTKRRVRYRYYVSHAILQKRRDQAGDVIRVPAPEIEDLVVKAVRERLTSGNDDLPELMTSDRDLVGTYVEGVTVRREAVEVRVFQKQKKPDGKTTSADAGNPDEPGRSKGDVLAAHLAQGIVAVRLRGIGRVEIDHIMPARTWDCRVHPRHQVAMWVDQGDAVAAGDVLQRHRFNEGRFARAGFPDDVDAGEPVLVPDAEKIGAVAKIDAANVSDGHRWLPSCRARRSALGWQM
jgi:DNA invertase Pin-like site-specific DNA recombinase